ncbi:DUF7537 family lipoprotein [Halosimplex salinum]|uniref:DUF7537 family lipoprotein n=1 Tax=Halosimplex salinum TaxID=1710538 RepID=UPI000F47FE5C|nr:hypothetical protein [Halosimplex salinum]
MRASLLSATAVVALLVLAGCTGPLGTDGNEPTPDASPADFPNASAIDQSVFDTHATAMADTSFALVIEKNRTDRSPTSEEKFRHMNDTTRYLVEPGASQYLSHSEGYFSGNVTHYSNGSATYRMWQEGDELTVKPDTHYLIFDESSEYYLWRGWFDNGSGASYDHGAIDATYEREGVETFQGVPVMRYEATGADALSGPWAGSENASWSYENFSATLLLDEDGVIRYYRYTFVRSPEHVSHVRFSRTYTLSDVGSTDVEKPDWATNVTAGS